MSDIAPPIPKVLSAPMGQKSALESHSMWVQMLLMVVGMLTTLGLPDAISQWLTVNANTLVGILLQFMSLYGMWATLRRKTTLTL